MKRILLIGKGPWGQIYIKTLSEMKVHFDIADRTNWQDKIKTQPDGVIVCTPPETHVEIASFALERNIPCMIEKPLSFSLDEALKLKQYTAPILVNHIHLFAKRYQSMKSKFIKSKKHNITSILTRGIGTNPNYSLWNYG